MTRARIATVCQLGAVTKDIEGNRAGILARLDRALETGPDLVCLPEAFTISGMGQTPLAQKAEPLDGPTVTAVARRAASHRAYVICPLKTRRDGAIYNSAIIIDRAGQIAGIYDKVCPVTSSPDYTVFEGGVTPGGDVPVFDLDFGRVGVQICFDLGFPENWQRLADQGAQLVFWPSAYDGGFPLRAVAYLHHYYVVSSVRSGRSRVIDPLGAILAETTDDEPVIWRDINLDHMTVHLDFNHTIPNLIRVKYGDRVDVRESAPGSGHFLVEPVDDRVTTTDLAAEFGFESTFTYHQRHREAFRRIRAGEPPLPQSAAHGDRDQYVS